MLDLYMYEFTITKWEQGHIQVTNYQVLWKPAKWDMIILVNMKIFTLTIWRRRRIEFKLRNS